MDRHCQKFGVIDGHATIAEYVNAEDSELDAKDLCVKEGGANTFCKSSNASTQNVVGRSGARI